MNLYVVSIWGYYEYSRLEHSHLSPEGVCVHLVGYCTQARNCWALFFFIWKEKLFSSDVTEPVERAQQDPESHGPN